MKNIVVIAALLLLASPAAHAADDWCSGSGQGPIDCPRDAAKRDRCTGWRDGAGKCQHGIGGSGMGPRGYVGTSGGRGR